MQSFLHECVFFLFSIVYVLQFFRRLRVPSFRAILVMDGNVSCLFVDVMFEMWCDLKFNNFINRLDLWSGLNCVHVAWETCSTDACVAKQYLPNSCNAPLTSRVWHCSSYCNFSIMSGNFWTTQFVVLLITWLYDSFALLNHCCGSQGCLSLGRNICFSKLVSIRSKYVKFGCVLDTS